jgi:hypothetical protein
MVNSDTLPWREPASAFHPRSWLRHRRRQVFERVLQRRFRELRRVGVKLSQLLDLLLDGLVLFRLRSDPYLCLRCHG